MRVARSVVSQPSVPEHVPYWRLSGFYLFYFGALGALVPYWSLYLKELNFSAQEIGELIAILAATKIIAPNLWGWLADHTGRGLSIVRLAALLAAVTFAGVFWTTSFWWLAGVMFLFSFFWNAALPQFEATTMNHLGEGTHAYSNIRLWGSVGFILSVVLLGPLLQSQGASLLLPVLMVLFAAIWFASLSVPDSAAHDSHIEAPSLRKVLLKPEVMGLLGAAFLMQASHGAYYTFYSIYLEDYGYDLGVIGLLWGFGVVVEVAVFMRMGWLIGRFSERGLLIASLLLASVRWLLIALFPEHIGMMTLAQAIHAATYGVMHAAAIHLIHRHFRGRLQVRGQAIYSSFSFGVGGAVGSLVAGYVWDGLGGSLTFGLFALVALVGTAVAWCWIRD
jgi:PPP family 3-phenylpropionic acid transporter